MRLPTSPSAVRGHPRSGPFAAEQLGAALGISSYAATQLMSDVLDLQHRLPRTSAVELQVPRFAAAGSPS